jgi:hypothetical protein
VSVLDGATVLQTVNLTTMESSGQQAQNQIEPAVETDGRHFLVAYSEFDATFGHYNAFVSDVFLAGSQLGLSQSHLQLHPGLGLSQRVSQIAAKTTLSGESHRYGVIYEVRQNDQDHDISAVLVDGLEGGSTSSFCFGDGSVIDCPCGNNGGLGRGCASSTNPNGALLTALDTASTVDDTLRLQASGMPPSTTCLFFQGTAQRSRRSSATACSASAALRSGSRRSRCRSARRSTRNRRPRTSRSASAAPFRSAAGCAPTRSGTATPRLSARARRST